MEMFAIFQKMGGVVSGVKKVAEVGKQVAEAAEILNRDEDHNGKPDIQDKFEKLDVLLKAAFEAHKKLLVEEIAALKVLGAEIMKHLSEVREGVK